MVRFMYATIWSSSSLTLTLFSKYFLFSKLCHMSQTYHFQLVSLFLSLKRHFRVFGIKYPVIAITTSKTTNLQYTLRHLRIIILANLTMPFITPTFQGCCSKILTQPPYDLNEAHFQKYFQTLLIYCFHIVLWFLSLERHFKAITLEFSVNSITTQKMANLKSSI